MQIVFAEKALNGLIMNTTYVVDPYAGNVCFVYLYYNEFGRLQIITWMEVVIPKESYNPIY